MYIVNVDLAGQVALITGAGSAEGIGFATARLLVSRGATVVVSSTTDRIHERAAELTAMGGKCFGVVRDLMEPDAATSLVAAVVQFAGRLDICVNNAGLVGVGGTVIDTALIETTDEQWADGIHRNLTTCFAVTRAAVAEMKLRAYGRIVNVASTSGPVQAFVGDVAYHAAKAGMVGFTRAVALECASFGVTVNAVAPGWIATASQSSAESAAGVKTPIGRSGSADEVAAAIAFFADKSASYVTGQMLVVDGGNCLPEDREWQ